MIERLRAWARRHTDDNRYSPVGIIFHWVMAFLVLFQLGWGWYASTMPVGGDKVAAYQVHSAAGLPILLLAMGRLAWRLVIPGPINDADTQGWQTQVAYATHYIFYICFFGLPLSGWLMWSAVAPEPLYFAGLFAWPQLPLHDLSPAMQWWIMDIAEDVHLILIVTLLILIPAHVGASLKHHFWDRHDVLRGMLPEIPDSEQPRAVPKHKPRPMRSPRA